MRDWMSYQLGNEIRSEIIRLQKQGIPDGIDLERIQKLLVLKEAKRTGDVRALRQWVRQLAGPEFGPELAEFIQKLPLKPGHHYPKKPSPRAIERRFRLLSAKAVRPLIRKILKTQYGSSRRSRYDDDVAYLAAHFYSVDPADVRQSPSGPHKHPRVWENYHQRLQRMQRRPLKKRAVPNSKSFVPFGQTPPGRFNYLCLARVAERHRRSGRVLWCGRALPYAIISEPLLQSATM
jgi:hypothetical protein